MLQSIHDKSQGWAARIILGVICFTFILWGVDRFFNGNNASGILVKVNGEPITQMTFQTAYQQYLGQQAPASRQSLLASPTALQALKANILQSLIQRMILVQAARQQGFGAGQELVELSLIQSPLFQDHGVFSKSRFLQLIQMMGYSQDQFLMMLKDDLMVRQVNLGFAQTSFALPTEVTSAIEGITEKRAFSYVLFPIDVYYKRAVVSDAEIEQYYQAHQNEFLSPEKAAVNYIVLSSKGMSDAKFAKLTDQLSNLTFEHPDDLHFAAEALKLPVQSTGYFTRIGDQTGIAHNPAFIQAAFSDAVFQQKVNSDLVQLSPTEVAVLHLAKAEAATTQPLALVKSQIATRLKQDQAQAAALSAATLWMKATPGSFSQAKLPAGAGLYKIASSLRNNHAVFAPLLNEAFALDAVNDAGIVNLDAGVAVVQVSQIQPGSAAGASVGSRVSVRDHLAAEQGDLEYQLYVQAQTQAAKIKTVSKL